MKTRALISRFQRIIWLSPLATNPLSATPFVLPASPAIPYERSLTTGSVTMASLLGEGWQQDRGTPQITTEGLIIPSATPYGQVSFTYLKPASEPILYVDFTFRPVAGSEQTAELVDGSGAVVGFFKVALEEKGEICILNGFPPLAGQPAGGQ